MTDEADKFARPGELRQLIDAADSFVEIIVGLVQPSNKVYSDMNHVLVSDPGEHMRMFFWSARHVAHDERVA